MTIHLTITAVGICVALVLVEGAALIAKSFLTPDGRFVDFREVDFTELVGGLALFLIGSIAA